MSVKRIQGLLWNLIGLVLTVALFASGCSTERISPSFSNAHPETWMDTLAPDFHGKAVFAAGAKSCASCHGGDFDGGRVDASCVSCHNSRVDQCTSCHGGVDNMTGSPAFGLRGETSKTSLAVGAHTAHMEGAGLTDGFACATCHTSPSFVLDSSHLDRSFINLTGSTDSIAEITWGGIADGGSAHWNRDMATCEGTYCHGSFSGGDASNTPVWTDDSPAICGSCHSIENNPASLGWRHDIHVGDFSIDCNACHANVVNQTLQIISRKLHVDGKTDTLTSNEETCNQCHGPGPDLCVRCHGGVDNQTGAPPKGLRGETDRASLAVGAHTVHLEGATMSNGFDCISCHIAPQTVADPGHYAKDSIAEITWGGLAGNAAQWDRQTASCSQTYCHGNFTNGISSNQPVWTDAGPAICGSCHDAGANPASLSGKHDKHVRKEKFECNECHAATTDALRQIIGRDTHVDGQVQVALKRGGTYTNGSCSPACHGNERWLGGD